MSKLRGLHKKNFNEEKVRKQHCLIHNGSHHLSQGVVSFTEQELDGVPTDVVSGYTKRTEDGKEVLDVTFKTPDILPVVCRIHLVVHFTAFTNDFSSNTPKTLIHAAARKKETNPNSRLMFLFLKKLWNSAARLLSSWATTLGMNCCRAWPSLTCF
jgi:hypothetical protein